MGAQVRQRTTKGKGGSPSSKARRGGQPLTSDRPSGGCGPPPWGKPKGKDFDALERLWKYRFGHEDLIEDLEQRQKNESDKLAKIQMQNVDANIRTIKDDFERVIEWLLDSEYRTGFSGYPVSGLVSKVSNWEYFLWTIASAVNRLKYREYHRQSRGDARYTGMGVGPMHRSDFSLVQVHCTAATGFGAPEFYLNMLGDAIGRYIPTTSKGSHPYERGAFTMGTLRNYLPPWYKLLWSRYEWPRIMMAVLMPATDQPVDVFGK